MNTYYWDMIRKAALNKLCIELYYIGSKKEAKRYELIPVSIRGTKEKNLTLYAYDTSVNKIKNYRYDRIQKIEVMEENPWPVDQSQIGYPIEVAYQECSGPKELELIPMGESNRPAKKSV